MTPAGTRAGTRRRKGSGHELRAVILARATELLAEVGDVEALTMRAVAGAAEVTPPSVYRHFPDKESLIRAVVTERFAEFTTTLEAAAAAAGEVPLDRLTAMARAYVRTGLAHPGHYRVLFSATHAGPVGLGLAPGTEHPGAASFRALVDAVAACLPDLGPDAPLAVELWASLHGLVDLRVTKPEMPWPDPEVLIDPSLAAIHRAAAPSR